MILPQVSEGMASAVAVAAKDCYRGKDKVMKGEEGQERHKDKGESDLGSEYADLFFYACVLQHRGGQIQQEKRGEIKESKSKKLQEQQKTIP